MIKKKIMILGAGILQLPAIKKAKNMGLEVIAVDMDPNAIGFKESGIYKEIISTIDIPNVLNSAKKHKIDGIMTLASDMPMQTVATVANELNLVGIDTETALKATNKAEMRKALKEYSVPIPLFFRVENFEEFLFAVDEIKKAGFRCIIKPADNSGSRGIDLLSDYEIETLKSTYFYSKEFSRSGALMIEEFMEGPEVSVETLSLNGICHVIQITDKLTSGAPYFVEMGHSQPSQLSEDIKEKIINVTMAANKAIGIKNGPSHTEIKITKDGPKIVELGARLGGDNITTHLTPLSTGVDMVECCIRIALGEEIKIEKKFNKGSAIRYFKTDKGKIKNILNLDVAEKIKGVKQISVVHGIGEVVDEIKSSGDRVGFVISEGQNALDAIESAKLAVNTVKFEMSGEK